MEPAEVLELNNQEALLAEQEEQQELAVMQALSMLLAKRAPGIQVGGVGFGVFLGVASTGWG